MIESSFDICIDDPFPPAVRASELVNFLDRVMTSSSRSEPVAASLKSSLPAWFEGVLDHGLNAAVHHRGDSERTEFAIGFCYVHSACRFGPPELVVGELIDHSSSGGWCLQEDLIHPRRLSASVELRHASYAHQAVGPAAQHERIASERTRFQSSAWVARKIRCLRFRTRRSSWCQSMLFQLVSGCFSVPFAKVGPCI